MPRRAFVGCLLIGCVGVGASCGDGEGRQLGTASRSPSDEAPRWLIAPSDESSPNKTEQVQIIGSNGSAATLTRMHAGEPSVGTTFYDVEFPGRATASWGRDDLCSAADGAMAWIVGDTSHGLLAVAIVPKWFARTASLSQNGEALPTERFRSESLVSDLLTAPALDAQDPPTLVGVDESEMSRLEGCDLGERAQ